MWEISSRIRHSFDGVLMLGDIHDGDTRDLSYPALKVPIIRGYDVAPARSDPLHDAVIRVRALVRAGELLEPRVPRDLERNAVLGAQLLQLCKHALGDHGYALCVEAVHHPLDDVDLVLDGKVEKVGIDKHPVRWPERKIVLEEKCGTLSLNPLDGVLGGFGVFHEGLLLLNLLLDFLLVHLAYARVLGFDQSQLLCKLACSLVLAH